MFSGGAVIRMMRKNGDAEPVELGLCVGRTAAAGVCFYPPGIPLIQAGEVYTGEIAEIIREGIQKNLEVIGKTQFYRLGVPILRIIRITFHLRKTFHKSGYFFYVFKFCWQLQRLSVKESRKIWKLSVLKKVKKEYMFHA